MESKKGLLFIWMRTGEKEIVTNPQIGETFYIERLKSKRMGPNGDKRHYLKVIIENGQRIERRVILRKNELEHVSIGPLEMFLGNRTSKIGLLDIGIRAPLDYKIIREFPYAKPLCRHWSYMDALIELKFNHGMKIPDEECKYFPGYDKIDKN